MNVTTNKHFHNKPRGGFYPDCNLEQEVCKWQQTNPPSSTSFSTTAQARPNESKSQWRRQYNVMDLKAEVVKWNVLHKPIEMHESRRTTW